MGQVNEGEVLIEYHRVGAYVKVSAIDPVTRTEVSIVGDPKRSEGRTRARGGQQAQVRHVQTGGGADLSIVTARRGAASQESNQALWAG